MQNYLRVRYVSFPEFGYNFDLDRRCLKILLGNVFKCLKVISAPCKKEKYKIFSVPYDDIFKLINCTQYRPRKSSMSFSSKDDEDVEEEADEVVPDGIEEVEFAKINLEQKEREQNLVLGDIRKLSCSCDASGDSCPEREGELWMIACGRPMLVIYRLDNTLVDVIKRVEFNFSCLLPISIKKKG